MFVALDHPGWIENFLRLGNQGFSQIICNLFENKPTTIITRYYIIQCSLTTRGPSRVNGIFSFEIRFIQIHVKVKSYKNTQKAQIKVPSQEL